MSHHNGILTEFHELRQHFFYSLFLHNHGIVDTGQLFDFKRNRHSGIDKSRKTVCDHMIFYFYGSDFYDLVALGIKTGCLNIKNNICIRKALSLSIFHEGFQIIHQICLYAVDYLKITVFWHRMICIRKRLHISMIGNCNRLMPPFYGAFNNILHI